MAPVGYIGILLCPLSAFCAAMAGKIYKTPPHQKPPAHSARSAAGREDPPKRGLGPHSPSLHHLGENRVETTLFVSHNVLFRTHFTEEKKQIKKWRMGFLWEM